MNFLIPVLVIALVAGILLAVFSKFRKHRLNADVYRRNMHLFSAAEMRFLIALDQTLGSQYRVLGKVRVADLVSVRPGLNPRMRIVAINKVAQKHVDFLLCDRETLAPACAIELNDSSHASDPVRRRDQFLRAVCAQAGLPLLVVKAAGAYEPEALRQLLAEAMMDQTQRGLPALKLSR